MTSECLFLVYHNFKSTLLEDYYDLKGFDLTLFKEQVAYLCRHYEPVTMRIMADAVDGKERLPKKCFYLTFDDGYKEQLLAAEVMDSMKVKGGFFINTSKLQDRKLITVDKQRFLLYGNENFESFLYDFCLTIRSVYPDVYNERFNPSEENIEDASEFYSEFSFYSNAERFYRKIRDEYLTEEQFVRIIDNMFPKYFKDEEVLLDKYFMGWEDLSRLRGKGMEIGCHSHSHPLLSRLGYEDQRIDIKKNRKLIQDRLSISVIGMTYPYGSFNTDTITILKEEGMRFGFMEDGQVDRTDLKDPFRLSRLGPERLAEIICDSERIDG